MASTSAYEPIRLIDPLLLDCVKAGESLKRLDSHHENTFPTTRVGQSLNSIEQSLIGALILLLNRTDRCRHPFRDTSLEEKCFKATLRGCADLLSVLIYNLSLLEAREFPVGTTWPTSQKLLEAYDRSLANLLGILSPARTGQSLPDFLEATNSNSQEAARLKLLVDTARESAGVAVAGGTSQSEALTNGTHPAPEVPQIQPPSRQSTIVDGVATPNRRHANCSGYRRGLREGRDSACEALKEVDLFEHEPPRGKRITMLYKAIDKGKVEAVNLLIDLGVNLNQLSSKIDGKDPVYLPLSFAARRGNEAIVKLLIEKGADIHARDNFGNNALLSAASAGRDKLIEFLLNAPYNADIEVQRMGEGDRKGFTPLMMAVYSGQLSSIRLLLDRGANREAVNEAGDPLLHIAATMGKLPTIELLLQNGSQVITTNEKTGDTALHCAVRNESLRVATFLIQKGHLLLDVANKKKQTPLALAVKLKKREMVQMLIEKGAKTDLGDNDGRTPLHNAVIAKDSEMIRLLVERGTKVESLDKDGRTPLYHAVRTEDPAIVATLLSSGYKMDVKNSSGRYPLQYVMEMPPAKESRALSLLGEFLKVHEKGATFHNEYHALPMAARKGKLQFVKDMLNNDPELVRWRPAATSGFLPPVHEAVKAGKVEVVKELCASRSYTLNINARDRQGNTALHQAILNNQIPLISLLIEKGADKELLTGQVEGALPPLHLAAREQNKKAVEALLQRGADCKRRITNVAPCEKCRALRPIPTGGNARCVLINLETRLRKPDFQEVDRLLFNAITARN